MSNIDKFSGVSQGAGGGVGDADMVAAIGGLAFGILDEFTVSSDEINAKKAADTALKQSAQDAKIAASNAAIAASNAVIAGTKQKNALESGAAGAVVGAVAGSILPGVGTAVGGAVGATIGAYLGYNLQG